MFKCNVSKCVKSKRPYLLLDEANAMYFTNFFTKLHNLKVTHIPNLMCACMYVKLYARHKTYSGAILKGTA